ncbi:MAG TPA: serine hydrolase [Puia sp.]|nr:serine hydrolase [Puia sp.]
MNKNLLFVMGFALLVTAAFAQQTGTDPFLEKLLREHASPQLLHVLDNPDSFRVQIIYTRIDQKPGSRKFVSYPYRYDPQQYFNPASTVKLPIALLALEKVHELERYGVDKYSPMLTDSSYSGQQTVHTDSTSANGLPSIAQYVKRIFLISDNDAYNRLYEFLGQGYIHKRLWEMGYKDVRIPRRFMPLSEDENRHTNQVRFLSRVGEVVYTQPAAASTVQFDFSKQVFIGKGHWDAHDSLINTPMDFTRHNNIPLGDLASMLQTALFPDLAAPSRRFHLTADDYAFLYRYMSQYPSQETHPRYDTTEYFDSYTKFFFFKAGRGRIPSYIHSFNKPGWSYGFLTDDAYIVDFKNNIDFMLSGTIYVNRDGILNDDKYEYEEVGYPFFKEVGEIIYQYELGRKRNSRPDLTRFKLSYAPSAAF